MTKLYKPFEGHPDYQCFGCSPSNPIGLNMEFYEEGDLIISKWQSRHEFQGFKNVLHGGIQSTMMDEIAAWCVNIKTGTAGVTKGLQVKFHKTVFADGQVITLKAKFLNMDKNLAHIHVKLFNEKEELCTEGDFEYFTFPEIIAKRKLLFPGKAAFYKPSPYLK